MKHWTKGCLALAVALAALSANSNANAQSVVFNGVGSSALYLELGQAALSLVSNTSHSPSGVGCLWTKGSGTVSATDPTTGQAENGQAWVAYSTGSTGSCSSPSTDAVVYSYLQTDSVVGDRSLFNSSKVSNAGSGTTTANLIYSSGTTSTNEITGTLPPSIAGLFPTGSGAGLVVTAAGTDIRPEDAAFATARVGNGSGNCGTAIGSSQYLGLGYPFATSGSPSTIKSYYSGSTFNVTNFSLPSSYTVLRVGAVPIVVAVNQTDGTQNGFGDPNITNINSSVLANFLDGTYSRTQDALLVADSHTSEPVTVIIREPLSGTYNTLEYNVPNTVSNQTSQDVGSNKQQAAQKACSSGSPINPLAISTASGGARNRAIGTGEALNVLFGTGGLSAPSTGLGYAFWSTANFKHAPATARYLTVDGVDPIENNYNTSGAIPTPTSGVGPSLANVTLAHVADGSYPIWSFLRLVCTTSCTGANNLQAAAQSFVSFGSATSTPDFVPVASIGVVRSHFTPPGVTLATRLANGTGSLAESGGDVGGVVYTILGDQDYNTDFSVTTGETGHRR